MLSTQHEILEVLSLIDPQSITYSPANQDAIFAVSISQAQALVKGRYTRLGPSNDSELSLFVNICGDLNMLYIFRRGIWHSFRRLLF